jgi:TfoX/Sxy family transcriptional regulator of competence genes
MKTTPFLEYLLGDIFDESLMVTARSMMGGYILYSEGRVFALAEDDQLWFKGSDELAEWYLSRGSKKFSYTKPARAGKEAKEWGMNYFLVPAEVIEDREVLNEWLDIALSAAVVPKKKR